MSDETERELIQLRALLASALGIRVDSNAAMLAATRRLRDEHEKWAAAIAETAVRLSDAGYRGQLVGSVTRLIAERDAVRDSRFRQAEEAAELQAKLDLSCGSCHPCTNYADQTWRAAGRKPPHVCQWDEARALLVAYRAHEDGAVAFPEDWEDLVTNTAHAADRHAALHELLACWCPATVKAAPTALCEKCRCRGVQEPDRPASVFGHFCLTCIGACHDMSDESSVHMCVIDRWTPSAAGVSGTGTEAHDAQ